MDLEVRSVPRDGELARMVQGLYGRAFPAEEQLAVEELQQLAQQDRCCWNAYFDDGAFCGFTFEVDMGVCLYVLFLAVNDELRSRGYGSRILSDVKSRAGARPVMLDVEPVVDDAPNYSQRARRLAFYGRNGFALTGWETIDDGLPYWLLSTAPVDRATFEREFRSWRPEEAESVVRPFPPGRILRRTRPDEVDAACGIIEQARARLGALGIDQWQNGYPDRAAIEADVAAGRGFLVEASGGRGGLEVLATAAFELAGEPTYDEIRVGAWLTTCTSESPTYLAVHRVAVADAALGRGAAKFLLAEAERVARERGLVSVRVDTHAGNVPMRGLLARCGYVECGVILLDDPAEPTPERLAFEKLV